MNNNINRSVSKESEREYGRQNGRLFGTNTALPLSITQGGFEMPDTLQGAPPASEKGYVPYYLASNIGKRVRAEFIVGTNQYMDKTGVLTEVGINYFVLYDEASRTNTMCDLYSVKFVTAIV